ncbi:MAG: thioredoxin-disulfide reductase [Candidatus Omnitrophota bacterium]
MSYSKDIYDVVVIGGGPAGLTAALYAGRSKLKTLVLEKLSLGGQVLLTETIENFPGVYEMNSRAWVDMFKKQIQELEGVQMEEDVAVEKLALQDSLFKTHFTSSADGHKDVIDSRCVIMATGATPKRLGIPGEDRFVGRGVSFCATCDGPLFKDKSIVVVGGGNAAIEEAIYLSRFAKHVTVLHRRDALRAVAVLQEKARKNDKISFQLGYVPVEMVGSTRLEGLKLKDVRTGQESLLSCDGVFIFIGFAPATQFLKGFVDLNAQGCVVVDENMESSSPGVFAAGDCRFKPLNQVVTACSDGAVAAFAAMRFLENKI